MKNSIAPHKLDFTFKGQPVKVRLYHDPDTGRGMAQITGLDLSEPMTIDRLTSFMEFFADISMEAEAYE